MLKIGITGGIGSGKSTVAKIFEVFGIPVYYADDAAKNLMNENSEVRHQLVTLFGDETYTNGILNRPYISKIVFNDPEKLTRLNAIIHPATIKHAEAWMQQQHSPYAVKEAALIFESGAQKNLDYVIGVFAPVALRLQRAMKRDNASRDEIEARMKKQMDEEKKMQLCDFIIINDEQQLIIPQVFTLHEQFIAMKS